MNWIQLLKTRLARSHDPSQRELDARRDALIRRIPAPTIWLFGKTGSGKSSIVGLLTGADRVQIGKGFRPTTRQTCRYTFPAPEMPIMHFLDTRGLGEAGYDAEQDIVELKGAAHAMIVSQRLLDFATETVIAPLRKIRRSSPNRPVLLALTCLHEAYPQQQHPPYPFHDSLTPDGMDAELARALKSQCKTFEALVDAIVPVDLTRPEEGYHPPDYGAERFLETLTGMLPSTYQFCLKGMPEALMDLKDLHERTAMPYIHSAAKLAATAALTPVPWIDMPIVAAVQTRMAYAIARIYHQQGSVPQLLEMLAAAGLGFAARLGVRELLKIVPYVGTIAGGILGAAMAYSYTYALGRVCCWYHSNVLDGHEPSQQEISQVFRDHWREGHEIWKSMRHTQA